MNKFFGIVFGLILSLSSNAQTTLWGLAEEGIFEFNPVDSSIVDRYIFPTNGSEGSYPIAGMTKAPNGKLYYVMSAGGNNGMGTVNVYDPNTNTNTVIVHFDGTNGDDPTCQLELGQNGTLYGVTRTGGTSTRGTIFTIDSNTDTFSSIHSITSGSNKYATGKPAIDTVNQLLYIVTDGCDQTCQGPYDKKRVLKYDITNDLILSNDTLPYAQNPWSNLYIESGLDYGMELSNNGKYYGLMWERYKSVWTNPWTYQINAYSFDPSTGIRTHIDDMGFYVSGCTSCSWTPTGRFTEHSNGVLYGLYRKNSNEGALISLDPSGWTLNTEISLNGTVGYIAPSQFCTLTEWSNGKLYGHSSYPGQTTAIFWYDPTAPAWATDYGHYDFPVTSQISTPVGNMVEVEAPPMVTNQPVGFEVCDETTNLSISFTDIGGDSYQWYQNGSILTGETDTIVSFDTISLADNGYFYCAITNQNGITNTDSAYIIVNPLPNVVANATPNALCEGDSLLLVGSGATSYVWDNGVVNAIPFLPTSDLTYTVIGTDNNGCTNIDSVVMPINNIDVYFVDDSVYCGGALNSTITGTGTSFTYNWTPSTDLSCTNCPNPIASPNILTNYHLQVVDNNGCIDNDSIVLSILAPPIQLCVVTVDQTSTKNVIVWEKPSSQAIDHFKVYRDVVGTYTHIVDIPYDSLSQFIDTSAGINPNATQYRYRISAVDTCNIESPQSDFHQTIHLNSPAFNGSSVDLVWQAYDGFDYNFFYRILRDSLSNSDWEVIDSVSNTTLVYTDLNPPVNYISTTRYLIEIAFAGTCSATKASNYSQSRSNRPTTTGGGTGGAPVANFISNLQNIPEGSSVDFADQSTNSPTSWSWTFTGGTPFTSNSQNPTGITYNVAGTYDVSLIATNANGSDTETKSGYITVGTVGIEAFNWVSSVRIYPNPNNGLFTIELENNSSQNSLVTIYNSVGQKVCSNSYSGNKIKQELNISQFGAGIYNVEININGQSTSKRLVVR